MDQQSPLHHQPADHSLRDGSIRDPRKSVSTYEPHVIEQYWRDWWTANNTFKTSDPAPGEKKFYCLDMFPYPSGAGLHVGHPVGYIASDIVSRMKRMQGFKVLHPMGWDAFGLPAEQNAIKTGQHPTVTTERNAANYKRQMDLIGLSYDWSREFSTTHPDYYKWTQLQFLKLYDSWFDTELQKARPISELPIPETILNQGDKAVHDYKAAHRLVYYSDIPVNWCPELKAVLANEEVHNGKSEQGYDVIRVPMRQVVMRISAYAERLLSGLEKLDWPESIKEQQRRWIGKSSGAEIVFENESQHVSVFTSRPETILGVSFVAISPESKNLDSFVTPENREAVKLYVEQSARKSDLQRISQKEKSGVFTGSYVQHPLTDTPIPVYIADYVLGSHGTGAVMGVPAHDDRDFDFAKNFNLPILYVVGPHSNPASITNKERAYTDLGVLLDTPENRRFFDGIIGISSEATSTAVLEALADREIAQPKTFYRIRDWVFSRQRYWGEPIPLIHWENGITTALSESELPLELPALNNFQPSDDGQSALSRATDWIEVTDPAGLKGRRETLTMPQWAGSSWYPLRFMDPHNNSKMVDPAKEAAWNTVDLYIGGAEHATLHLLYSRFWFNAMYDLGMTSIQEPFDKLYNQGMLTSFAYEDSRGAIVAVDEVTELTPGQFVKTTNQEPVTRISAKMSKSLRNVVNPDDVIEEFGADSFRVYLMFMGPVDGPRVWETRSVLGSKRFLGRIYDLATQKGQGSIREFVPYEQEDVTVKRRINQAIEKVTQDIEQLKHHTAIAEIMKCLNDIEGSALSRESLEKFVKLLSPFAPFLGEELWARLGHSDSINFAKWPEQDTSVTTEARSVEVPIQVNSKKKIALSFPAEATDEDIGNALLTHAAALKIEMEGATVKIVRDRQNAPKLVNIVPRRPA